MPFKHPSEKYKRARERRKEAVANGKYCCPNCKHLFGDGYSLKRHVKSCPPLSTIIVPTSVVEIAPEMSTVTVLPVSNQVAATNVERVVNQGDGIADWFTDDILGELMNGPESQVPVRSLPSSRLPILYKGPRSFVRMPLVKKPPM